MLLLMQSWKYKRYLVWHTTQNCKWKQRQGTFKSMRESITGSFRKFSDLVTLCFSLFYTPTSPRPSPHTHTLSLSFDPCSVVFSFFYTFKERNICTQIIYTHIHIEREAQEWKTGDGGWWFHGVRGQDYRNSLLWEAIRITSTGTNTDAKCNIE